MNKVTMQDIADYLNISKNSVSQALRNKNGVSQQTKNAVLQAAKLLGYNYSERKVKKSSLKFILFATNFALSQTSFFGELVSSIQSKCMKENIELTIQEIDPILFETLEIPNDLNNYDGVLILSHSNNEWIRRIIDTNIPTVIVDHHDPTLLSDTILTKNTDGAFSAISLLVENGYKNIGFIGDISFSPSYSERYRGYKRAIDHFELPFEKENIITEIEESQGALFTKLNQIDDMPEAWFCVNSGLAFMLNSFLQSREFNIPEDIGIICFDDTEFTRMAQPKITNVATNLEFMGALSISTLLERIEKPNQPFIHKQIVPTINVNESIRNRKSI
ncbi:substrate-binding domain-containing protein [Virgibacillus proomii]|jgi:LacI family transcriptional regulator|uniref:substrate-binding domain-containing protein n=1 Tax=Virgibacillus proomii TaxID=84407 RepID=UPI000987BEFF|nr:substrate-binding domain-containing protein [Virgibacillus proomii]